MSTLTMSVPARQPFASLSGARLRSLTNTKNAQNALPSIAPSSLKRRAPDEFDELDAENIDPIAFSSPSKKNKTFDFDLPKAAKSPMFTLTPLKPAQYVETAYKTSTPPKLQIHTTPSSAPAPAGRSPTKAKKAGILSRRRKTTNAVTSINPPSFKTSQSKAHLPFSIDAALAGTVPALKSKKAASRKGWQFDIHQDTPDDEMANLMEHSTCTLDISDDEGRFSPKGDTENKENIPPIGDRIASQPFLTRREVMTDEPRSALSDLDAKDYYAEGCDELSCFIVPGDDHSNIKLPVTDYTHHFSSSLPSSKAIAEGHDQYKTIVADLEAKNLDPVDLPFENCISDPQTEIQIWESESAKAEDEADRRDA